MASSTTDEETLKLTKVTPALQPLYSFGRGYSKSNLTVVDQTVANKHECLLDMKPSHLLHDRASDEEGSVQLALTRGFAWVSALLPN